MEQPAEAAGTGKHNTIFSRCLSQHQGHPRLDKFTSQYYLQSGLQKVIEEDK
jgi:hypothetical protein